MFIHDTTKSPGRPQAAAEQAMPATAVAGPVPSTGVVPLPQERGKAPQATQGVFHTLR